MERKQMKETTPTKKTVDYYMTLEYPVVIREIPEHEGGGYTAYIPMLGKSAFVGDGETIEEALANLEEIKRFLFAEYLKKGVPIAEPVEPEPGESSGRFLVRTDPDLHALLKQEARRKGISFNQLCSWLLARGVLTSITTDAFEATVTRFEEILRERVEP